MYLSLIFFLTLAIPFIIMPRYIRQGNISPYSAIVASILMITVFATVVFLVAELSGEGVYEQIYKITNLVSEQAANNTALIESFDMAGISEAERVDIINNIYRQGIMRIPVTIMFWAAIASYIAYIILSNIMGNKHAVQKMPKFREFSFTNGTAMAIMAMYIIAWIMMEAGAAAGEALYANINMLFDLVFSIQGIAVVFMFFHFKRVPQAISVVVSGVMWITSIGKVFLVLLGMADLFLGIRKMMASNNNKV